jgi:hypothetical protein
VKYDLLPSMDDAMAVAEHAAMQHLEGTHPAPPPLRQST